MQGNGVVYLTVPVPVTLKGHMGLNIQPYTQLIRVQQVWKSYHLYACACNLIIYIVLCQG
jgi:hypothetical protein